MRGADVETKKKSPRPSADGGTLSKYGGDLLSHKECSTIGAAELNCSVRDGKRWSLRAVAAWMGGKGNAA